MTHDPDNDRGLEPRVARLEADVAHILTDVRHLNETVLTLTERVSDIRVDLADMKVRIDQKPDKDFIVKVITTAFALLAAISLFHDRLTQLFH